MNENTQPASGPRVPLIDKEMFNWLTQIDSAVAKAPLTRIEAIQIDQAFQNLLKKLELMQGMLNQVQATPLEPCSSQDKNTEGEKMVQEAIDAHKRGLPNS